MGMKNIRLQEFTATLSAVATSDSIDPVDLNYCSKYSVQCMATIGASISHLEASNDKANWTEIDNASISESGMHMFEEIDVDYRYMRIRLENNDIVDVSGSFEILVIGSNI